jgi:ABC-type Fe3+ transport system permease subunit
MDAEPSADAAGEAVRELGKMVKLATIVGALVVAFFAACASVQVFGAQTVYSVMVQPVMETPLWQLAGYSLIGAFVDAAILVAIGKVVAWLVRQWRHARGMATTVEAAAD